MLKSLFSRLQASAAPPVGPAGAGETPGDPSWAGLPTASDDELVGKSLNGTYVVESVLGEGGMGRVYRAHHTRIAQKRFAIKVLRPEFTKNAEALTRFRREAEAAACITHVNVVGVYDVDTTDEGFAYLVCEFLEGMDLAGLLERSKRVDVPTAVHIVIQVCRALEAAHGRGVVHRDLKPHNIFLLAESTGAIPPRPTIKVLDFGLSRFMDSEDTQLTRTGMIMGTPAYMAPEQAGARQVDHRADIYGVGAVLYAALTGQPPFVAEHLQGVVLAVLTEEPRSARQLNASIPENLELVLQRAMAKDPNERYQSMAELRQALEPFAAADTYFDGAGVEGVRPASRGSRAMLEAEAYEVSTARPRLLLFGAAMGFLLLIGLSSAVASLELFTSELRFTKTEFVLAMLAVLGTLLTPGLLLFKRFKRTVWGNHARVLELLSSLKTALITGVVSYGTSALLVRFLDDVLSRFELSPLLGRAPGSAWAGWNGLFFVIALLAALLSDGRRRLVRAKENRLLRSVLPAILLAAIPIMTLVLLELGFIWRAGAQVQAAPESQPSAKAPAIASSAAPAPSAAPSAVPSILKEAPPGIDSEPPEEAPDDELARATSAGVDGLLPLAERYPRDPAVLKPLVLAFASRATGLADAMAISKRLFAVAPAQITDPDLRFLVKKAASAPGEASKLAFELLTDHMGSTGPDLLYELYMTSPKTSKRAEELLQSPNVKKRSSPALAVAWELRNAASCQARVPLLERAAELGDERSALVLSPLSASSKRGCGKWKRSPCQPVCATEAPKFNEAIARISARLAATRP